MALTGGCLTNSKPLETIASEFGSAAGYGLALLGQICRFVFFSNSKDLLFSYIMWLTSVWFTYTEVSFNICHNAIYFLYIFLYFRKSEQFTRAAECFKSSLKYNPYLWSSFENLCQLGMTLVLCNVRFRFMYRTVCCVKSKYSKTYT